MSTLTAAQVYALATGAGFDPATARTMTAIAGAESSFNTTAKGDVAIQDHVWGPSIGLWQVRSLKSQTGTGRERDATRLTDPAFNAKAAHTIYRQQGLSAWSTYTNGAYRAFLPVVDKATKGAGGTSAGAPADASSSSGGGGWGQVSSFFTTLGQHSTWVRVLQVAGGAGLLVAGLLIVNKSLVVKTAATVLPAGKAATAATAALSK